MKRYAAMAKNPKGDLVNIAFDNRTFQHKHSAKHFAEQMSDVVMPEIVIVEVDEITDTERLEWLILNKRWVNNDGDGYWVNGAHYFSIPKSAREAIDKTMTELP